MSLAEADCVRPLIGAFTTPVRLFLNAAEINFRDLSGLQKLNAASGFQSAKLPRLERRCLPESGHAAFSHEKEIDARIVYQLRTEER